MKDYGLIQISKKHTKGILIKTFSWRAIGTITTLINSFYNNWQLTNRI